MKYFILLLLSLAPSTDIFAQSTALALKGASFAAQMARNYRQAGELFEQALKQPGAQASAGEFYNAACSWALAGEATKAFRDLDRATQAGWDNLVQLKNDTDLISLHTDKRWPSMLKKAEIMIARVEAKQNIPLKRELQAIYESDQASRRAIGPVQQRYGAKSTQSDSLFHGMQEQDAKNEARVKAVIEQYGWPGAKLVGRSGSMAAFLVIQHSDLVTIQKYLPLIRQETAKGGLDKRNLVLMEDRVLVFQNKPQLYGSQVHTNSTTGKNDFFPIEDESHVDERRAKMDLGPLTDYAKMFGIDYVPKK